MATDVLVALDTEFTDLDQPHLASVGLAEVQGDNVLYVELSEWVDFKNWSSFAWLEVRPLLQGGKCMLPRPAAGKRIVEWLAGFSGPVVLITDAPNYDWKLLQPLIEPHISDLEVRPCLFDSMTLGPDWVDVLRATRASIYDEERVEHHALWDAIALRATVRRGIEAGWRP